MAITPSAFLRMLRMIREIDVRALLPAIHVPTLVIQRTGDRINPPFYGRYLATHIAGARYFEQPGDHVLRFASGGDLDVLFAEIEDFLATPLAPAHHDRALTTILAAEDHIDTEVAQRYVRAHRGRVRDSPGPSLLATFDAPGRAIRCAAAIRDHAADLGTKLRLGIHTGEVELLGDDIAGVSVDIAKRIVAHVTPGEIIVSRTVKDLVVGSGISFADRGSHQLTDTAGNWALYSITAL
jgi:class 3 adenylate cyclase